MIPESEISECPEHKVKSKIGNIFVNEKILEEYSIKIYKTDPYFYEHYKKKYKLTKMGVNTFRTDVYFTKYLLAVEIDKKNHASRDIIFGEKRQEALEKKLNCEFIRINTSKRYDEDYEIVRIQSFISEFKDRQLKKLEKESNKKIKELEDEIKELKLQLTSQITQ